MFDEFILACFLGMAAAQPGSEIPSKEQLEFDRSIAVLQEGSIHTQLGYHFVQSTEKHEGVIRHDGINWRHYGYRWPLYDRDSSLKYTERRTQQCMANRIIVTRNRDAGSPTWCAARVPAFIVSPEIWHLSPDCAFRILDYSRKSVHPTEQGTRRTFGEYLLNPDPDDRWIFSMPNIYFEF